MTEDFYIGQKFENEYPPEVGDWCGHHNALVVELDKENNIRVFQIQQIKDKSQDDKEKDVRYVRQYYFEKYVDFYQSKPLLWEELDDTTKQYISEYRQYLKDYTETENWWEQNPKTYEEWLVAHHPVV